MRILHQIQIQNQRRTRDQHLTDPSRWIMKYKESLTDSNHQTLMEASRVEL